MDRNLPLKPTIAFLACIMLIISALFYFAPVTVKPPIGQLYRNANDELIALESHYLVPLSKHSETISMAPFLQGNHVGQLIPLRSGELIINSNGQSRNILLNFKSLFRISDAKHDAATSLLRCNSQITVCQPWGDAGLFFRMGWSGLELRNGQIIINDSTRHRVLLLSPDGHILSELTGFKFPNHAVEVNDSIWITDTNHNQIVAVRISDGRLVRTGDTVLLENYSGIQPQHRFPSVAQVGKDNQWWVMVNDHNMAHPGIYRLNAHHTATQIADNIEDITAMLVEDSQLFVASYPDNQVWHVDTQTLTSTILPSSHLAQTNQLVEQQVTTQKLTLWTIIGGLALLALGILAYAIKHSTPAKHRETLTIDDSLIESDVLHNLRRPTISGVVWIVKQKQFEKQMKNVERVIHLLMPAMLFITAGLILFLFFAHSGIGSSASVMINFCLLVAIAVIAYYFSKRTTQGFIEYELGADKNHLVLRHIQTDKRTIVLGKDIVYTKYAFYAGGVFFQFKNPKLGDAYDVPTFKQYVLPIITQGQRISEWAMIKKCFTQT